MPKPDISVIIPAYKAASTISRSIASVMAAREVNLEIIVVEDGHEDSTKEVLRSFSDIRLISLPTNKGVCYARNTGLAHATADFLLFLDADDVLDDSLLSGIVRTLRTSSTDLVFAPWRFGGPSAEHTTIYRPQNVDADSWLAAWMKGYRWTWGCPSRIGWRRTSLLTIGGWNLGFPKKEDSEIMARALTAGLNFGISNIGCSIYWRDQNTDARSYNLSDEIFQCQWGIYEILKRWTRTNPVETQQVYKELGPFCYRLACETYYRGNAYEGNRWLGEARTLGLKRHPGSSSHVILSMLLGLKYKKALERKIDTIIASFNKGIVDK